MNIIQKKEIDNWVKISNHANSAECNKEMLELNPVFGCDFGCRYCGIYAQEEEYFDSIYYYDGYLDYLENYLRENRDFLRRHYFYFSAKTDCFQTHMLESGLTRSVLELLLKYNSRYFIVTKGGLPPADIQDLLIRSSGINQVIVSLSMWDEEMREKMEPNAAPMENRFNLARFCVENGIVCTASCSPLIPIQGQMYMKPILERFLDTGVFHFYFDFMRLSRESIGNITGLFPEFEEELAAVYSDPGARVDSWHLTYREQTIKRYRPSPHYMYSAYNKLQEMLHTLSPNSSASICNTFVMPGNLPRFNTGAERKGFNCIGARF